MMKLVAALFLFLLSIADADDNALSSSHAIYGKWLIEDHECYTTLEFQYPDELTIVSGDSVAWGHFQMTPTSADSISYTMNMKVVEANNIPACGEGALEVGTLPYYWVEFIKNNMIDLDNAFTLKRL